MNQKIKISNNMILHFNGRGQCYHKKRGKRVYIHVSKLPLSITDNIVPQFLPDYIHTYRYLIGKKNWTSTKEIQDRFKINCESAGYRINQLRKHDLVDICKINQRIFYYKAKILKLREINN